MRYVLIFIAVCALVIGVLFILGPAEGRTIVVDDDWAEADYDSIQEAVLAADDGDTVRVHGGIYAEVVDVEVSIDLVGNGTSTVIDGSGKDHVFGITLRTDGCNVSGFNFTNWWPTHEFGGIGVYSDGNRVFDNTFYYNSRGVFLGSCKDNAIFNNTFEDNFYHLLVHEGASDLNISFNRFIGEDGSGILIRYSSRVDVFSNTFEDYNTRALAVYRTDDFTISFNMFHALDTTLGSRRGCTVYETRDTSLHNNTFVDLNSAVLGTGNEDLRVEHNTILGGVEGLLFSRAYSGMYQLGRYNNGTVVRNNNIAGLAAYGANATGGQVTSIDARYNWWGDASGPYQAITNPGGSGSEVAGPITFGPWQRSYVDDMPPVAFILDVTSTQINEGEKVAFLGRGLARNVTTLHVWTSDVDGEIYSGGDVSFATTDLSPGTHRITLKVRDDHGKWSEGAVVTVVVNGLPVASIVSIEPPLVNEGEPVHFLGKGVDHENDIRRVMWESDIDGVLWSDLEFHTASLSNGTHLITLKVMDGFSVWSEVAVGEVIVNGLPRACIASVEHPLVNESEPVILRGGYLDHEDGVVAFWWGSNVDGQLSDQPMFHTCSLSNGTHVITFRVRDDFQVWSENATATVTVNGLPRAHVVSIDPATASTGEAVSFDGSWTDHEGSIAAHEWRSDIDGELATTEDFETGELSRGVHTITYRVMDDRGAWSEWAWSTVQVNDRPIAWIEETDVHFLNEGETFRLAGGSSDAEDGVISYEWRSSVDGIIGGLWNLTTDQLSNGTHTISFRVADIQGAWSDVATTTVTVNGLPRAAIVDIEPASSIEGDVVKFTGAWTDHEEDVTGIAWTSDLDGVIGRTIEFATTSLSTGSHVITLRVEDGHGSTSEAVSARIKVNGRPMAVIGSVRPECTMEGERVFFEGEGEDDLAVVSYRWTSSIDGELSDIAVFSTTGLSPGIHDISFQVQDNEGVWSAPAVLELEVMAVAIGAELVDLQFPSSALEGDTVTISTAFVNGGNVPLAGLVIEVLLDGEVIGAHTLKGPLSPGSRRVVELDWTAEEGSYVVAAELSHQGSVVSWAISEGRLDVEGVTPNELDPSGPDAGQPTDRVSDGNDGHAVTVMFILAAAIIVIAYMVLTRSWRDR